MRGRKHAVAVGDNQWRPRPAVGVAVRLAVFVGPVATGLVTSWAVSRVLPAPHGLPGTVLFWATVTAATIVVLVAAERLTRRLLPLATLFSLSLVFPDRAPSRFRVARQVGRPAELRRRLEEAQKEGATDDARRMQTVLELVTALAVHDKQTRGHSERVRVYTDLIAEELKLSPGDRARLRWASLLHDVGKLNVSHGILTKPGRPTKAEWDQLRRHPEEGARLVASILPWLGRWGPAVVHHHERWDGQGYPRGLKGEEISLGGRIVAVADAFEVMTAARPYKRAMRPVPAREELVRCSGTHFDPAIVRAFLNVSVGRLWRAMGPGGVVAQLPLVWPLGRALSGLGERAGPAAAGAATATTLAGGGFITAPPPVRASPPATNAASVPVHSVGAPSQPAGRTHRGSDGGSAVSPVAPTAPGSASAAPPSPVPPHAGGHPPPLPAAPPLPDLAPTVSIGSLGSLLEGATLSGGGSFTDPDSRGWTATVDYGDGTGVQPLALGGGSFLLSHIYGDTCTCTVTVAVTDDAGATGQARAAVTVDSAPITVSLNASASFVGLLQTYRNQGLITDPDGASETFTATVDYGDGAVRALAIANGAFTLSHLYLLPGTYAVTVTVTEGDDGSHQKASATVRAL